MNTKTIARYVRESTREQAMNGYNLSDQKKKIVYYLKTYEEDYRIVDYEDGGYSAKSLRRPGLQKLLEDIKEKKIKIVIIHNLDRLTRRIKDLIWLLEYFKKYNVKLISITEKLDTDSASGKFFTYLLCLMAQWEQDTISERTIRGLNESANQGNYVLGGKTPFGFYKKGGKLLPKKEEIKIVKDIYELTIDSYSSEQVARLIQEKYKNYDFNADKIIRIIKNKIYTGNFNFQGKIFSINYQTVSEEVFKEANELVAHRSRIKRYQYAFQDLVFTEDGHKMTCICGKSKGKLFLYYFYKPSNQRISEQAIKDDVLLKLSTKLGKKEVDAIIAKKKSLLSKNLKKQKSLLDHDFNNTYLLKELIKEQEQLESIINNSHIRQRLIFLNSIAPSELNAICKDKIKRIIVCKSKKIMVEFKC